MDYKIVYCGQQSIQADGWAVVPFRIPLIFTFTEDLLVSNFHRRLHHSGGFGFLVTMWTARAPGIERSSLPPGARQSKGFLGLANEGCDWKISLDTKIDPWNIQSMDICIYIYIFIHSHKYAYIIIYIHICIIIYNFDICITILNLDDHQNFVAFVCTLISVPGRSGPTSSTLTTANESSSIRGGRTTDDTYSKKVGTEFQKIQTLSSHSWWVKGANSPKIWKASLEDEFW